MLARYDDLLVQSIWGFFRTRHIWFIQLKANYDYENKISPIFFIFRLHIHIQFPQIIFYIFIISILKVSTSSMINSHIVILYIKSKIKIVGWLFFWTGSETKYIRSNLYFYEQLILGQKIAGSWEIQLWDTADDHATRVRTKNVYGSCRPDGSCGQRRYSFRMMFDSNSRREMLRLLTFWCVIPQMRISHKTMVQCFTQKSFSS